MSNSHLFLKSGFIRIPSQNGVGRYIPQLQRIVLKFCKNNGSSRGMRDFIERGLIDYARENPGTVVYLKPRRHRTAVISAEYLNGDKHWISCRNFTQEEITKWLNLLRTQQSNKTDTRMRKLQHTDHPSIQGPWTPYTFRNPAENLAKFPNERLSQPRDIPVTATEQLVELFQRSQVTVDSDQEGEEPEVKEQENN